MGVALDVRAGIREIGLALRRPEALVVRWRDRRSTVDAPVAVVFPVLVVNAEVVRLFEEIANGVEDLIESVLAAP